MRRGVIGASMTLSRTPGGSFSVLRLLTAIGQPAFGVSLAPVVDAQELAKRRNNTNAGRRVRTSGRS